MGQALNTPQAGYMTKQLNNVYEGEFINGCGDSIYNGTIVTLTERGFEPTSTRDVEVLCKELTTIYGDIPAARFIITDVGGLFYLVDNHADVNTSSEYDATNYATPDGKLLRAHPLQVGEEFIATTPNDVLVDSTYNVVIGRIGTIGDPT